MSEIRPIDANALMTVPNLRKVTEFDETGCGIDYIAVPANAIENATTLECEVVKHSNWELKNHRYVKVTADGEIHCPECHSVFTRIVGSWYKRCPECGAIMDRKILMREPKDENT